MFFKIFVLALLSLCLYNYCFKILYKIYFYKKQGVTIMPGCWRPIIGNLLELGQYHEFAARSEDPLTISLVWMTQHFIEPGNQDGYDYTRHKAILMNIWGDLVLQVNCPEMAQDVY